MCTFLYSTGCVVTPDLRVQLGITTLGPTIQLLLTHSIAESNTRRSYESSQRQYESFCSWYRLIPLPASQQSLCLYVGFLYEEGLAHSSIKCYLSAVRHLQISRGYSDPFSVDFPQLQMLPSGNEGLPWFASCLSHQIVFVSCEVCGFLIVS